MNSVQYNILHFYIVFLSGLFLNNISSARLEIQLLNHSQNRPNSIIISQTNQRVLHHLTFDNFILLYLMMFKEQQYDGYEFKKDLKFFVECNMVQKMTIILLIFYFVSMFMKEWLQNSLNLLVVKCFLKYMMEKIIVIDFLFISFLSINQAFHYYLFILIFLLLFDFVYHQNNFKNLDGYFHDHLSKLLCHY